MLLSRILSVDDHEPFRRLTCSLLEKRPEFQIVGQASDGLEAIQKAAMLQPDLILLDIGLPKLDGLRAAAQIRLFAPRSKILFLSQELSLDVVQHALDLGALGCLNKTRAGELLLAIDSVLAGKQYISTDLEIREIDRPANAQDRDRHEVGFYSDNQNFLANVSGFIAAALKAGNAAIVMATESRRDGLIQNLKDDGVEIDKAVQQGTYISLDADKMLSDVMVGDLPDSARFLEGLSNLIETASGAASKRNRRVAIFGECCGLLWAEGNTNAAIQIERMGNELIKTHNIEILCAYPLHVLQRPEPRSAFATICEEHSAVHLR